MNNLSDREQVFIKSPSVVARKIGSELILVPIRQKAGEIESIYTLNEVAGRVWELIDGRANVQDLVRSVVAEFDVTPDEAEHDIRVLLGQLLETGAIRTK